MAGTHAVSLHCVCSVSHLADADAVPLLQLLLGASTNNVALLPSEEVRFRDLIK